MISEAFACVAALAGALGVKRINELPGLWSHKVDVHWTVRVNGHDHEIESVPPYHAAVEWNGFPAGIFGPSGGIIAAGAAANEQALIEALRTAIRAAGGEQP